MPLLRRNSAQRPEARISPGTGMDDVALVAAARGDPHDFAPLFLRYWDSVLRYCTVRLHDHHDAEDAASQVFVDAYAGLHRFQDRGRAG